MTKFMRFVLVVVIVLVSVNGEQDKKSDQEMCGTILNVLCVKTTLEEIAAATNAVQKLAIEMKHKIIQHDPNKLHLISTERITSESLEPTFPVSKYHEKPIEMDTIDRNDFVSLMREEHAAVSYLYNSINSLLNANSTTNERFEERFNRIQTILRKEIFCNYLNILRVYSKTWLPIYQISSIKLPQTEKNGLSSLEYNSYSIVVLKLVIQWMQSIEHLIGNFKYKFM